MGKFKKIYFFKLFNLIDYNFNQQIPPLNSTSDSLSARTDVLVKPGTGRRLLKKYRPDVCINILLST